MAIRPIKSADDHEAALREIERLWGAAEGSADGDTRDVLLALVDTYESAHHASDLPDPISAIRFRLEQAGLSLCKLSGVKVCTLFGVPARRHAKDRARPELGVA